MYCTNCGNKLRSGAKFCSNCGARIVKGRAQTIDKTAIWNTLGCLGALLYIPFGVIAELTKKYK